MSNNIYNILGKLKTLTESVLPSADKPAETVYENVEPRGSISEAVKALEGKYAAYKEAKKAKPDFLDIDKDGDTKEPMKKAAADKKKADAKGAMKGMFGGDAADLTRNLKIKESAIDEAVGDLTDLDDYQFAEPDKDTAVAPLTVKQSAAERRRRLQDIEDRRAEKDDWFDGDDKPSAVTRHHAKLQAEPEELDEYSQAEYDQAMSDFKAKGGRAKQLPAGSAKNPISTASRHIAGRGEAGKGKPAGRGANVNPVGKAVVDVYEDELDEAQIDELQQSTLQSYAQKALDDENYSKRKNRPADVVRALRKIHAKQTGMSDDQPTNEVAPPGAKAERMVKNIKKGYAKDGKLTKREKGIAYATAWKAKKAGSLDESTTPFKPAMAAQYGDAEWAEMVAMHGQAGAEKMARTTSPDSHERKRNSALASAQNQAAIKNLNDPLRKEKEIDKLSRDRLKAQGDELRKTMSTAKGDDRSAMRSNELGQIGQMSTVWQPKDATTNYQGQPGQVRLTGKNTQPAAAPAKMAEGTEFKDTIKNSAAKMTKAKPAMVKESRIMEETDYFYEKIGKALAEKNPNLDTAGGEFEMAVRKEMVAQGVEPNRARNILLMDEDFLGDVATSYGHYCKEVAECGAPMNSHLGGAMEDAAQSHIPSPTNDMPITTELDEIARLAGLPVKETDTMLNDDADDEAKLDRYHELVKRGMDPDDAEMDAFNDELDEGAGVTIKGKPVNVKSISVDGVNDWDSPDFADAYATYAEYEDGTPLSEPELDRLADQYPELINQAAHGSLQDRADFLDEEEDMAEGNEFSGALAAARASGAKEFEVDGKRYTVKEDIHVNITANGEQDTLNLFRKLAGMGEVESLPVGPVIDADSAIAQGIIEPVEEERDIEYVNTPNEKIGPISAAIPSGDDMHRSKKQYRKEYPGDNPMAVKEDTLWKKYAGMLQSLIK